MRETEQKIGIKRQIESERRRLIMGGTSRSNRTNKSEKKEVTKVKEVVKVPKPKYSEVECKAPTVVTLTRTKIEPKDKKNTKTIC